MSAALRVSIIQIILLFILAATVLVHPVRAEDATSTTIPRKTVQQKIDVRKEKIDNRMESRIAVIKERVASKEAALKAKLEAFKDKRKAEIAQRVNTNLNRINQNQTQMMQKHLDKMSSILDRLEKRVNEKTADIKDPGLAKEAIVKARANIASASAAVRMQAEKDYTVEVSTEGKIKADVQRLREQLHTDLQQVRKTVINAKQSVGSAIRIAKSGQKEGSESGKQ